MYDCVPPFLIEIAPCDITTPFVEPPPIPKDVVISAAADPSESASPASVPQPLSSAEHTPATELP